MTTNVVVRVLVACCLMLVVTLSRPYFKSINSSPSSHIAVQRYHHSAESSSPPFDSATAAKRVDSRLIYGGSRDKDYGDAEATSSHPNDSGDDDSSSDDGNNMGRELQGASAVTGINWISSTSPQTSSSKSADDDGDKSLRSMTPPKRVVRRITTKRMHHGAQEVVGAVAAPTHTKSEYVDKDQRPNSRWQLRSSPPSLKRRRQHQHLTRLVCHDAEPELDDGAAALPARPQVMGATQSTVAGLPFSDVSRLTPPMKRAAVAAATAALPAARSVWLRNACYNGFVVVDKGRRVVAQHSGINHLDRAVEIRKEYCREERIRVVAPATHGGRTYRTKRHLAEAATSRSQPSSWHHHYGLATEDLQHHRLRPAVTVVAPSSGGGGGSHNIKSPSRGGRHRDDLIVDADGAASSPHFRPSSSVIRTRLFHSQSQRYICFNRLGHVRTMTRRRADLSGPLCLFVETAVNATVGETGPPLQKQQQQQQTPTPQRRGPKASLGQQQQQHQQQMSGSNGVYIASFLQFTSAFDSSWILGFDGSQPRLSHLASGQWSVLAPHRGGVQRGLRFRRRAAKSPNDCDFLFSTGRVDDVRRRQSTVGLISQAKLLAETAATAKLNAESVAIASDANVANADQPAAAEDVSSIVLPGRFRIHEKNADDRIRTPH